MVLAGNGKAIDVIVTSSICLYWHLLAFLVKNPRIMYEYLRLYHYNFFDNIAAVVKAMDSTVLDAASGLLPDNQVCISIE